MLRRCSACTMVPLSSAATLPCLLECRRNLSMVSHVIANVSSSVMVAFFTVPCSTSRSFSYSQHIHRVSTFSAIHIARRGYAAGGKDDKDGSTEGLFDKAAHEKRLKELDDDEDHLNAARSREQHQKSPSENTKGSHTEGEGFEGGGDDKGCDDTRVFSHGFESGVGQYRDGDGGSDQRSLKNRVQPSLRTAYPPSAMDLPESSFLKCIEKEIADEKLRLDKEEGAPPAPTGWELHHVKGTSIIYGRRMWLPPATAPDFSRDRDDNRKAASLASEQGDDGVSGDGQPARLARPQVPRSMEKHFIRIQLTTRDASLDPECDIRGEHFPFSFFVQRIPLSTSASSASACPTSSSNAIGDAFSSLATPHAPTFDEEEELSMYENSVEVRLDVVDGELVVEHVVYHGERDLLNAANRWKLRCATATAANAATAEVQEERESPLCNAKTHRSTQVNAVRYNDVFGGYPGPNLDEAEEEVLDGIQSWLAERQIDDRFGEFVGQYSVWVEQAEYEQWLQQLYNYVAA